MYSRIHYFRIKVKSFLTQIYIFNFILNKEIVNIFKILEFIDNKLNKNF